MVKFCVLLRTSSGKTQMLLLKRIFCMNIDCFVVDSLCLHLTFVAFCLLSVICKQLTATSTVRAPDQILDRFYVISMEFLSLKCL